MNSPPKPLAPAPATDVVAKVLYFYHGFPRFNKDRSPAETVTLGLNILRVVYRHGLLLAPEFRNIAGIPLVQRRICFTALSPSELADHAEDFGAFALEFELQSLLEMGALPAIYYPELAADAANLGDAGVRLVRGLDLVECVLNRLKDAPDPIAKELTAELKKVGADLHNLRWVPTIVKNLLYPAGSPTRKRVGPLGYFDQREWKIIENFPRSMAGGAVWDFKRPTQEQKDEILAINPWFNGEHMPGVRRIDDCFLFARMGEARIVDRIRRVIVPKAQLAEAQEIVGAKLTVTALEDLVG